MILSKFQGYNFVTKRVVQKKPGKTTKTSYSRTEATEEVFCELVTEKVRKSHFRVGAVLCTKNDEKTFQFGRFMKPCRARK